MKILLYALCFIGFLSSSISIGHEESSEEIIEYTEDDGGDIDVFVYRTSDGEFCIVGKDAYEKLERVGLYQNIAQGFVIGLIAPAIICYRGKKVSPSYLSALSPGLFYRMNECPSHVVGRITGYLFGLCLTCFFLKKKLELLI